MKKILGLMVAALLVMMMVGGGTWAYFSDTETSTGNSLSAGTLDLKIGAPGEEANANVVLFNVASNAGKGPGSSSIASKTTLKNSGTMEAELEITTDNVDLTDGPVVGDAQIDIEGADINDVLVIAPWLDVDRDATWSSGDFALKSDGTTYSWTAQPLNVATGGSTTTIVMAAAGWNVNAYVGCPVNVAGKGTRVIVSNTATTITVGSAFSEAVANLDTFNMAYVAGVFPDVISAYDSAVNWTAVRNMPVADQDDIYVYWVIPWAATNSIQGDQVTIDFTFRLEQPEED